VFEIAELIKIAGVDKETVEKDYSFPKAYAFYIKLSRKPSLVWTKFFSEEFNRAQSSIIDIQVVGDRLRVVFTYSEDIQRHMQSVLQLVENTNNRAYEYNREVKRQEEIETAKQQQIGKERGDILRKLKEL